VNEEKPNLWPHLGVVFGMIFVGATSVWAAALIPIAFYGFHAINSWIPNAILKASARRKLQKEKEKETAPFKAELRRMIDEEREADINSARQRMGQRIELAKLISDPLLREQEEAQARTEFAKVVKEANAR
jgi:hypothetical protein